MNNIFENAYFGKPYKTRDGKKAIYIYYGPDVQHPFINYHHLIYDGQNQIVAITNYEEIISEWQEEINEEELDKFAEESSPRVGKLDNIFSYKEGFKEGYRKAKGL